MERPDEKELLKVHRQHQDWLSAQPGVARTGIELSPKTGDPTIKVYTKTMPATIEGSIRNKLGRNLPIEFEQLKPGDEAVPY